MAALSFKELCRLLNCLLYLTQPNFCLIILELYSMPLEGGTTPFNPRFSYWKSPIVVMHKGKEVTKFWWKNWWVPFKVSCNHLQTFGSFPFNETLLSSVTPRSTNNSAFSPKPWIKSITSLIWLNLLGGKLAQCAPLAGGRRKSLVWNFFLLLLFVPFSPSRNFFLLRLRLSITICRKAGGRTSLLFGNCPNKQFSYIDVQFTLLRYCQGHTVQAVFLVGL